MKLCECERVRVCEQREGKGKKCQKQHGASTHSGKGGSDGVAQKRGCSRKKTREVQGGQREEIGRECSHANRHLTRGSGVHPPRQRIAPLCIAKHFGIAPQRRRGGEGARTGATETSRQTRAAQILPSSSLPLSPPSPAGIWRGFVRDVRRAAHQWGSTQSPCPLQGEGVKRRLCGPAGWAEGVYPSHQPAPACHPALPHSCSPLCMHCTCVAGDGVPASGGRRFPRIQPTFPLSVWSLWCGSGGRFTCIAPVCSGYKCKRTKQTCRWELRGGSKRVATRTRAQQCCSDNPHGPPSVQETTRAHSVTGGGGSTVGPGTPEASDTTDGTDATDAADDDDDVEEEEEEEAERHRLCFLLLSLLYFFLCLPSFPDDFLEDFFFLRSRSRCRTRHTQIQTHRHKHKLEDTDTKIRTQRYKLIGHITMRQSLTHIDYNNIHTDKPSLIIPTRTATPPPSRPSFSACAPSSSPPPQPPAGGHSCDCGREQATAHGSRLAPPCVCNRAAGATYTAPVSSQTFDRTQTHTDTTDSKWALQPTPDRHHPALTTPRSGAK